MSSQNATNTRPSLKQSLAMLGWRRSLVMLALGFSAGLPILLVFSTLSAWLRFEGVSRSAIGFFAWAGLAYTFKFLWAPLVDRLPIPFLTRRLGRRRSWMLVAQIVLFGAIAFASTTNPGQNLWPVALITVIIAFASATQDIALDAWRIDVARDEDQALLAAIYQWGYRFGMIAAGFGVLAMAAAHDFHFSYRVLSLMMLVGPIGVFFAPEPKPAEVKGGGVDIVHKIAGQSTIGEATTWLYTAVIAPFADFVQRYRGLAFFILALIGLYRLTDFVMGFMANPFYLDMGYTLGQIATISKFYGIWVMLAGALLAGIAANRWGVYPVLLAGAILGAGSNLGFAWLATQDAQTTKLVAAITLENLSAGWAGTALIAYMSSLTNRAFSATQYALFSSFYALPGKLFGGFSGIMVDKLGYPLFFVTTAAIGVPAILFVLLAMRWTAARALASAKPQIT